MVVFIQARGKVFKNLCVKGALLDVWAGLRGGIQIGFKQSSI